MISQLLAKIFGTNNARQLKRLQPLVEKINSLEARIQQLSDEQLKLKTDEFKEQLSRGRTLDSILPEAFAVVREAARRALGQRHYDVQLIGGIVLHQGKISEMKTGEGKTLTATLPLYLHALAGKGAHLITVNDYLARRDAQWMSPVFTNLGLTVGVIQNSLSDVERKKVYACDIVYATNNELGFDYLRDNMKFRLEDYVQRPLHYGIVDEVDSILIDEARTPLIISGASDESSRLYTDANRAIAVLGKAADYEVDEKARSVQLTESGNDKMEEFFQVQNLYALEHIKLLHHINQALRAHALFKRDVDYVVKDDQVLIVDEFTGRILPGRRYSDGLHQALEAKENVKIERETQTLASITLQNYFRLYEKLAGMTGTALTEAEEFHKIYKLDVISIPTNMPMIRKDEQDLIFLTKNSKYKIIVEDIKERYKIGQPVLIGTIAIETSELLSMILTANGISHEVLNAKNHAREAEIIAHAGEKGRVTIATNMAGRGTDIKVSPEARDLGGLYILGTERHESRRIDNQLRGRSGRQGDPGESRFYISLEDDLIRIFAGDSIKKRMEMLGMTEDENIEGKLISKNIESSQEKVEKHNFEMRRHLLEYDDVLNQQRTIVYRVRRDVLEGQEQTRELVRDMISDTVVDFMHRLIPAKDAQAQDFHEFSKVIAQMISMPVEEFQQLPFYKYRKSGKFQEELIAYLLNRYEMTTTHADAQKMEMVQDAHKWLMLETIDQAWKQHMLNLDHLKEGISLRSWGQKNPLIEYKREAFAMFEDMMRQIRAEVVHHVFHLNIEHFNQVEFERKRERELEQISMMGPEDPEGDHAHEHEQAHSDKIGRNEDCPCGSGKKYKKCCGTK
jgi:preprotein translocase subunit SecA